MNLNKNLSPKREFKPSNPNLEEDIKNLLTTPVKFERQSIPNTQLRNQHRYNYNGINDTKQYTMRKSLPSNSCPHKSTKQANRSSITWNPPEIEDDIGYSSGVRRAFDLKHKKYSEVALRQNERRWEDEEKFRRWKAQKDYKSTEIKSREHDHHVVENIIQSRNDYYVSSMKNFRPPIRAKTSMFRTVPAEIRSVGRNRIYYWA